MLLTSVALAALAIALAWPVPILLVRAHWPARLPGTALVLWQSIALTGGLSMIGSLLVYGLEPYGDNLVAGLTAFGARISDGTVPFDANFSHMFALSGAILLGIHLVLNLALTVVRTERLRRRHSALVTLLSDPMPERPHTRVIDHAAPVAYCLPGATSSVTVLSAGLIALLDDEELLAVIAHERAHANQRHHLVLIAFRAWRASLPWFPIATRAHEAVAVLVEMLADDHARHSVSDATLIRSIALVAGEFRGWSTPDREMGLLADDGEHRWRNDRPSSIRRIARLTDSPAPGVPFHLAIHAIAIALITVPTALLLSPAMHWPAMNWIG